MEYENSNDMRDMMASSFGDEKISKKTELNAGMTISPSEKDEYEQKIHNIGGQE